MHNKAHSGAKIPWETSHKAGLFLAPLWAFIVRMQLTKVLRHVN
jgi:hypothetical protein